MRVRGRWGAISALLATVLLGVAAAPAEATPAAETAPPRAAGGSPAVATPPAVSRLAVIVPEQRVLTLPAGDGFRDALRVTVIARTAGAVDVRVIRGTASIRIAHAVRLRRADGAYRASIRVGVRGLRAGRWTVRAARVGTPAASADATRAVVVGSGTVRSVVVTPASRIVYPFRDGRVDTLTSTVTALDETGTALPATGTLQLTSGTRSRTAVVSGTSVRLDTGGLPPGSGRLVARMTGPAGPARRSGALHIALRPTAVATVALATSAQLVEPVVDDVADTVTITAAATTTLGGSVPIVGSIAITGPQGLAKSWRMTGTAPRTVTWDGRVAGRIIPGTYLVTASARGPQGEVRSRSSAITVSADHLPYRARLLFTLPPGNQQGLAVHGGVFAVATDLGDGTSRIDEYGPTGAAVGHLGPVAIGHGAELTYSPSGDVLYAANGGPATATTIFALDPATGAIERTIDLTALGANGMVAVDPAGNLLVFAGSPGAYTVSVVDPASGSVLVTDSVAIDGLPQGIDLVNGELWIYTSLGSGNRITRFTMTGTGGTTAITPSGGSDGTIALAALGEGEGLAFDGSAGAPFDPSGVPSGSVYIGAHRTNRIAVLDRVPDE